MWPGSYSVRSGGIHKTSSRALNLGGANHVGRWEPEVRVRIAPAHRSPAIPAAAGAYVRCLRLASPGTPSGTPQDREERACRMLLPHAEATGPESRGLDCGLRFLSIHHVNRVGLLEALLAEMARHRLRFLSPACRSGLLCVAKRGVPLPLTAGPLE